MVKYKNQESDPVASASFVWVAQNQYIEMSPYQKWDKVMEFGDFQK